MKIKRSLKFWWQRRTRGWDDSETWSLDRSFTDWILPRLKRYYEIAPEVIVIEDEFKQAIEDMIEGFTIGDDWKTKENKEKVDKAYEQFGEWGQALWW